MPTLETLWRLADAINAEVIIGPNQALEIRQRDATGRK